MKFFVITARAIVVTQDLESAYKHYFRLSHDGFRARIESRMRGEKSLIVENW